VYRLCEKNTSTPGTLPQTVIVAGINVDILQIHVENSAKTNVSNKTKLNGGWPAFCGFHPRYDTSASGNSLV